MHSSRSITKKSLLTRTPIISCFFHSTSTGEFEIKGRAKYARKILLGNLSNNILDAFLFIIFRSAHLSLTSQCKSLGYIVFNSKIFIYLQIFWKYFSRFMGTLSVTCVGNLQAMHEMQLA